ncbi:unnamed protein product [[Actinomadura] parvosata subsp. kistnae]|nr:unnamed protein product [Actinomadura parvosata subsp. kistnae]
MPYAPMPCPSHATRTGAKSAPRKVAARAVRCAPRKVSAAQGGRRTRWRPTRCRRTRSLASGGVPPRKVSAARGGRRTGAARGRRTGAPQRGGGCRAS